MQYFNLHTHKYSNQENVLELVNQYPQEFDDSIPFYSIGIHPLFIDEKRLEIDLEIVAEKLASKNCLALGECGLDKRSETDFEIQKTIFERQLILAQKNQKPVVIHCVSAFQELIEIKKRLQITVPIIVHGFSKKIELATQLIGSGFYISFGKYLFLNPELESVFKSIPNNRFLLETDTINEGIEAVYALAANYKNLEINKLQEIVNQNCKDIFDFRF